MCLIRRATHHFLAIVALATLASAQVILVPDTPVATRTATGVTATPECPGKIRVVGLGISGTIELVAPTPPAGTVVSNSNIRFPGAVNVQIRQSWSAGSSSVTLQGAFGRCSTNLDTRDCQINFLEIESSGRAYLDADIQLVSPNASGFPTVAVRFRWVVSEGGCAAPAAAPGKSRAACLDTISLESVSPAAGDVIFANAENKTPPHQCGGKYTLDSTASADIVLQLFDQSGTLLGTSTPVTVGKGSGTAGRATGCQGTNVANGCLTLPPTFYDKTEAVALVALIRDALGNSLAQSSPLITYRIVNPKVTLTVGSLSANTGSFTPIPADTLILGGSRLAESLRELILDTSVVRAAYDYPGLSAQLSIQVTTDEQFIGTTRPIVIKQGTGIETIEVGDMKVPTKGEAVAFVALLRTSSGQTYRFPPVIFPMETISRGSPTPPEGSTVLLVPDPDPSRKGQSLPIQFSFPVTYHIGPEGAKEQKSYSNYLISEKVDRGASGRIGTDDSLFYETHKPKGT